MVIRMRVFSTLAAALVWALPAGGAFSQDLSPEQLIELFNKQVEAQTQPKTRSLGETRGLSLVTVEDVVAEPVSIGEPSELAAAPQQDQPLSVTQSGNKPLATQNPTGLSGGTTVVEAPTPQGTAPRPLSDPNAPLVYAKLRPDLQVNLHIQFSFDSAALSESEVPKLEALCAAVNGSEIPKFRIIGHTDTSGTDAYNQRLSTLRAKEVARHLVQECGVAATRLETVGMGERFPSNAENTRADENRRVEFQALS